MNIKTTPITFKSTSGLCDIHGLCSKDVDNADAKGVIQIVHGMCEHKERYEKFINTLCENGYVVYIHDHLGHGESVKNDDDLGFFGKQGGYKCLVEDAYQMHQIAKKENPGKKMIFFGHSMGSFVARLFAAKYGSEIDSAIFCGSKGPTPGCSAGIVIASAIAAVKGDHYRSKMLDSLAVGGKDSVFEGRTGFDWLTRDNDIVDKYVADYKCGFCLTCCGFRDLFHMVKEINDKSWFEAIPDSLPVLLISGQEDPVGGKGKGITTVYNNLKNAGKEKVFMHLYKDGRHEILNDHILFPQVVADILKFIEEN